MIVIIILLIIKMWDLNASTITDGYGQNAWAFICWLKLALKSLYQWLDLLFISANCGVMISLLQVTAGFWTHYVW